MRPDTVRGQLVQGSRLGVRMTPEQRQPNANFDYAPMNKVCIKTITILCRRTKYGDKHPFLEDPIRKRHVSQALLPVEAMITGYIDEDVSTLV